jgi:hypothetical protein
MGVYAGPEVVNDGLVLSVDAGNTRGFDKYENLALNSEAISAWNNNGNAISISANSQIAPDGTLTADVLSQTAVTGASRWVSSTTRTYTAGVTYTLSIWLKKISGTDAQPTISLWVNNGTNQSVGTITTEWVRYSKSFTPVSTISSSTFTGLNTGWNDQGVANNFTFAAWGFQVEIGSTATDYYPTTSTTKTRGSTLIDLSGRDNNGTLVNGVEYTGSNGGHLSFDGTNDYVDCGPVSTIGSSLTGLTVNVWINTSVKATKCIAENGTLYTTNTFYMFQEDANYFTFAVYGGAGVGYDVVYANFIYQINTWYNLTGVWSSNSRNELYCNGVLCSGTRGGQVQSSVINGNTNLLLGSRNYGSFPFSGKYASASFYNRALTASEIQQNFNATKSRYGL